MPISGKEKGWEKRDCLCFNFFENGELVNTKFRDSQKHFKLLQGARTIPYNIDAIRDTPECILVEGEFDALSYMAVGRTDVISVPNGANSQLDWLDELSESHFEQKQVIYLSVDTDRKGRELCRELSRRLGVYFGRGIGNTESGRNHEAGNGAGAHRHRYSRTWQIGLCR